METDEVVVLVEELRSQPGKITLDEQNLYFIDHGVPFENDDTSIVRALKNDGLSDVLVTGLPLDTYAMCVDDTHLYWGYEGVFRVELVGSATPEQISDTPQVADIYVDAGDVYIAAVSGLLVVPAGAATATTLDPTRTYRVVVDETHVYYTRANQLMTIRKTGGSAVSLGSVEERDPLANGSAWVFSADGARWTKSGGRYLDALPARVYAQFDGEDLALDHDGVIFHDVRPGNPYSGRFVRIPQAGGPPRELSVDAYEGVLRFAADADAIFFSQWGRDDTGQLLKLVR